MTGTSSSPSRTAGFTLIELLVAVAIFSVVLLITMGIFARFISHQRLSINEQQLQEDLRIALELMSREIRTGYGSTFESINAPTAQLFFRNQEGHCVSYRFADDPGNRRLVRAHVSTPDPCSVVDYASNEQAVTEFGVGAQLENVIFTAQSATKDPDPSVNQLAEQGYVTISLSLRRPDSSAPVTVQSTITSRNIIPYD